MTDHFDEKRGMVKKLLDMLKQHAASEVSTGLQHPEGEGDMHGIQAERVEMADHDMDEPTPEHDVVTHEMHTGGIVDKVSPIVAPPMESDPGHPDKEGAVHKEVGEGMEKRDALTTTEHEEPLDTKYPDAEEEQPSMFASFLSRKRKK
jgi:hypothetical protein